MLNIVHDICVLRFVICRKYFPKTVSKGNNLAPEAFNWFQKLLQQIRRYIKPNKTQTWSYN